MGEETSRQFGGSGSTMTRRTALKRMGAGAAAVWSVPLFISTAGAAAAEVPDCPSCPQQRCGKSKVPAHARCGRYQKLGIDGDLFCGNCGPCSHVTLKKCTSHAQCPSGWLCADTCCHASNMYCIPKCGLHGAEFPLPHAGDGTSCFATCSGTD